jgi:hypothetical protein
VYPQVFEEQKAYGQLSGEILRLLWSKDFVQRAGKALLPKASKPGKRNARPVTRLLTGLLSSMPTWETKIRPSGGSTPLIRSTICTWWV